MKDNYFITRHDLGDSFNELLYSSSLDAFQIYQTDEETEEVTLLDTISYNSPMWREIMNDLSPVNRLKVQKARRSKKINTLKQNTDS